MSKLARKTKKKVETPAEDIAEMVPENNTYKMIYSATIPVEEVLKKMEAEGYIKVILCKNCIHYKTPSQFSPSKCSVFGTLVPPDGYCYLGKSK
jgi:predicted Zn-ribbon and HTH transcriptional regulator